MIYQTIASPIPFQPLTPSSFDKPCDLKVLVPSKVKLSTSFDSSSSGVSFSSESTRCDDYREFEDDTGHKSKYKQSIERRHRNYHSKKKTELCKTYLLGLECPYGDKCSFAHGETELKPKVCVPPNFRTEPCIQFCQLSICNYGPRCQFRHPKKDWMQPLGNYYELCLDAIIYNEVGLNCSVGVEIKPSIKIEEIKCRRLPVFSSLKN